MTALTTLRSLVTAQVPLANDLLVDRTLIEIARDFCDETRAWRSTVTATVTASTLGVTLTPPTDGELVDVVNASLDTVPLTKKTQSQLDVLDPQWRTRSGTVGCITLGDSLNQVLVAPLPGTTSTNGLTVRAAWKPALSATTLDDVLVSKHSDTLVAGALGKLFAIPEMPWTNAQLAGFYASTYAMGKDDAKQTSADDRMQGVTRKVRYGGL